MKIKLNTKQIEDIRRGLKETDRKNFDVSEVSEVFRMLQYWSKTIGTKEAKIKSVTELSGGYLCRVNRRFRDSMKEYLKEVHLHRRSERLERLKERKAQETLEEYERLIKEAEEKEKKSKWDE